MEESPTPDPLEAGDKIPEHPIVMHYYSFLSKRVKHLHLTKADWALLYAIRLSREASFMLVYGPTGIVKKSNYQKARQKLFKVTFANPSSTSVHFPVAKINAISPGSDAFNWHDYYSRVLSELANHCTDHGS